MLILFIEQYRSYILGTKNQTSFSINIPYNLHKMPVKSLIDVFLHLLPPLRFLVLHASSCSLEDKILPLQTQTGLGLATAHKTLRATLIFGR